MFQPHKEEAVRRHGALLGLFALLALTPFAYGHLCDNVWGQLDKLILKPEITSLVVKDQASFKVLMQSNMDRAMATALRLVGESPAFDVTVDPEKGYGPNIDPGVRYEYTVTLKVKPGQRSGQYPLAFRLVGTREGVLREVKTLQMGGALGEQGAQRGSPATEPASGAGTPIPAPTEPAAGQQPSATAPARKSFLIHSLVPAGLPVMDGKLEERCWQGAMQCTGFVTEQDRLARWRTQVLMGAAPDSLYFGIGCQGGAGEAAGAADAVTVYLARPGAGEAGAGTVGAGEAGAREGQVAVTLDAKGKVTVKKLRGGEEQEIPGEESGVKGAVVTSQGAWFGELAVPAKLLGQQGFGTESRWLVNFVRSCQVAPAEVSFWQGKAGSFLESSAFAEFRFLP